MRSRRTLPTTGKKKPARGGHVGLWCQHVKHGGAVERPSRVGTRHCRVATRQTHGLALGSPWVRQRRATVVQRCSNGEGFREGFREGFYAVASFAHAVAMPGAGVQHL